MQDEIQEVFLAMSRDVFSMRFEAIHGSQQVLDELHLDIQTDGFQIIQKLNSAGFRFVGSVRSFMIYQRMKI